MVMSGQYRTFDQTWHNIKKLIDLNDIDVYCHLWSNDPKEKDNIQNRLKPKLLISANPEWRVRQFEAMEQRIFEKNPKGPNQDKVAGNASMNYSRKMGLDLVPKDVYDTVVYCRYDIQIEQPFMLPPKIDHIITPVEESYGMISDIFAIMPWEMTKSYFLFDDYERLQSENFEAKFMHWLLDIKRHGEDKIDDLIHRRYCPHALLARSIIIHDHQYQIYNLPVRLQR